MDTGDRLPEYMVTPPSDTGQFYGIRAWKPTPGWRADGWDSTAGYVDDAVAGKLRGKTTPPQVAHRLRALADQTLTAIDMARREATDAPELMATTLDFAVLAHLAQYHAEKTLAATDLAFFEATGS